MCHPSKTILLALIRFPRSLLIQILCESLSPLLIQPLLAFAGIGLAADRGTACPAALAIAPLQCYG